MALAPRILIADDEAPICRFLARLLESEPWDVDLTGDVMLIVGGEHDGVPEAIMEQCDDVVSIPMAGFVPSYNLQAPLAVVALEALRQRRS